MLSVIRGFAVACAFTLAFVVNPMFVAGCISGDEDDEPSAERLAEIEGALVEHSVDLSFGDDTVNLEGDTFRLAHLQVTDLGIDFTE
jgi:hypothetical protein